MNSKCTVFRFAGSANARATQCLLAVAKKIIASAENAASLQLVGKSIVEFCLDVIALSIAMVEAGTGHIEAFKLFRRLHGRVSNDQTYGNHMAVNMALGLLFLGEGQCSLGNSNADIAALLTSLFPCFPSSSSDNLYHLQALRHLYVLASTKRVLNVIDVDTREAVLLPIRITSKSDDDRGTALDKLQLAPSILPEPSKLISIATHSDRYWPVTVDFADQGSQQCINVVRRGILFIKRKAGNVPLSLDAEGLKLTLRSIANNDQDVANNAPSLDLRVSRSQETDTKANIMSYLAKIRQDKGHSDASGQLLSLNDSWSIFAHRAQHHCLETEKPDLLQFYLTAYMIARNIKSLSILTQDTTVAQCCAQMRTMLHVARTRPSVDVVESRFLDHVELFCNDSIKLFMESHYKQQIGLDAFVLLLLDLVVPIALPALKAVGAYLGVSAPSQLLHQCETMAPLESRMHIAVACPWIPAQFYL